MNRIILTGILLAFVTISLFAQRTVNKSVSAYDKIHVCCGIELYLSKGEQTDLKIEVSDDNLLTGLTTDVRRGELVISYDDKKFKRTKGWKIKIHTTANNLTAIKASSGAGVISETPMRAKVMQLTASSGAEIKYELTAGNITCSASSGSNIILKGQAYTADVKATSGSNIKMESMKVDKVDAQASSGSGIKVHAVKEIKGKASSGADIRYSGNPEKVDRKQSSGGTVKQM